jgi:uncharacterized protein (TIGR03086 family)
VHATRTDQLGDATPCDQWAVRDLLNHLVGGGHMFAMCLRGESLPDEAPGDLIGDDHVGAFDAAIANFLAALDSTTDLGAPVTLPFATVPADVALRIAAADLLLHSWDLARATGQAYAPPAGLVESAAPFFQQFVQPEVREHGFFGAEVSAPADASAFDRLVAFSGRSI